MVGEVDWMKINKKQYINYALSSLYPLFRMKMLPIRLFDRLLEGTAL
jgi:hypothetical protein